MNNVYGIDFGTSNSCISYYNIVSKKVEVIPNNEGKFTSPTMIYFSKNSNEILYGNVVKNLLNSSNNNEYLENIFTNIKRLIGITYYQYNNDQKLKICFERNNIIDKNNKIVFQIIYNNEQREFTVQDLLKLYLNYLKTIITSFENKNKKEKNIYQCCLTVPAYFNDNQREIIKKCTQDLDFNVLRILNEPTSAALCYANNNNNKVNTCLDEYILVIDCGGGTTDISLLHLDYTESIYEVKNTAGDNFLGGEDITNSIAQFIQDKLKNELKTKTLCSKIKSKIKKEAEYIKKQLSINQSVKSIFEFANRDITIITSKTQFNELSKDFFRKIKNLIYYVLDSHIVNNPDFTFEKINKIIFVGGSTRIPYFKTIFKDLFNKELNYDFLVDPDQAISIGASLQGALLNNLIDIENGGDTLLLDVIPLSIGIETIGGLMSTIISRNTMIPISRSSEFLNSDAFEDTITINIFQGERKFTKDNHLLTTFELKSDLLAKYDKETILIKITFEIDSDSIITAKATTKVNDIEIKSKIEITKKDCDNIFDNTNLNDILFNSEMNKLIDCELASKTLLKLELYDSFKYLLGIFHEKRQSIIKDSIFLENQLNTMFNKIFNIINTFNQYTCDQLKEIKKTFENDFHSIIFFEAPVFEDFIYSTEIN